MLAWCAGRVPGLIPPISLSSSFSTSPPATATVTAWAQVSAVIFSQLTVILRTITSNTEIRWVGVYTLLRSWQKLIRVMSTRVDVLNMMITIFINVVTVDERVVFLTAPSVSLIMYWTFAATMHHTVPLKIWNNQCLSILPDTGRTSSITAIDRAWTREGPSEESILHLFVTKGMPSVGNRMFSISDILAVSLVIGNCETLCVLSYSRRHFAVRTSLCPWRAVEAFSAVYCLLYVVVLHWSSHPVRLISMLVCVTANLVSVEQPN